MDIKINRRFNEKELPDMKTILDRAEKVASTVTIGESEFMRHYGVKSEAEYKRKMMVSGHIMKHSHIGWNSVSSTAEGFHRIYEELTAAGTYVDRFGVCLDGTMGVPLKYRDQLQEGSGQVYRNKEEWAILNQQVPIQVHMGDHMIGSLNSVENCVNALEAGVTTIGNISHYYSYEYPGLDLELERTVDTCEAVAVMGHFGDQGTIIHSNLDDGMGAKFHDLANLAGWARMERYIVEELLGGRMNFCFGNLFSDPILRITFNKAMWDINTYQTPGSMIYGNTIDFGLDIPRNYGALSSFTMADIIGQMKYPTGHAVCAIPVTEAIRVPSVEEILDAHHTLDIMMEKARYYMDYINFDKIEEEARLLNACGNVFFERVLNAFDDMGVDITHAGELMAVLKGIDAEQLEIYFGVGKKDELAMRGRIPVCPTNIVQTINETGDHLISHIHGLEAKPLEGVNIVLGTTDIHVFGKEVIKKILLVAGANVYDLGDATPVEDFADTLIETESKILMVSTYNGMAYSFGKAMSDKLKELGMDDVGFWMGGRLNEAMDGNDLPEDVSDRLADMGINVDNDAEIMVDNIRKYLDSLNAA